MSIAPSIGTLAELQKRREGKNGKLERATVVGDPSFKAFEYQGGHFSQLHFASKEAHDVEECLDGCRLEVTAMRGHSATKANALATMPQSDIIHLATHGTADGMFFAGTSLADAKLTMSEAVSYTHLTLPTKA